MIGIHLVLSASFCYWLKVTFGHVEWNWQHIMEVQSWVECRFMQVSCGPSPYVSASSSIFSGKSASWHRWGQGWKRRTAAKEATLLHCDKLPNSQASMCTCFITHDCYSECYDEMMSHSLDLYTIYLNLSWHLLQPLAAKLLLSQVRSQLPDSLDPESRPLLHLQPESQISYDCLLAKNGRWMRLPYNSVYHTSNQAFEHQVCCFFEFACQLHSWRRFRNCIWQDSTMFHQNHKPLNPWYFPPTYIGLWCYMMITYKDKNIISI